MSDRNVIEIDFVFIGIVILFIFFYGDPDLHSALINFLMECKT